MNDFLDLLNKFIRTSENSISVAKIMVSGVIMSVLGMIFIHQYALQFSNIGLVFASAALIAFASLGVGGLIGFLFAIPKSLDNSEEDTTSADPDRELERKVRKKMRLFVGNTNLEQISDWLTKILVGAGLTQIPALLNNIKKLVTYISPALNGQLKSGSELPMQVSQSVTLSILVYFSFCGFLWLYLWARLDLPRKLTDANELKNTQ